MKRWLLMLLAILLLGMASAHAGEGMDASAVIAGTPWSAPVELLQKPGEENLVLGKLYSGTPVQVWERVNKDGKEWAAIYLAGEEGIVLEGYVPMDALMMKNRNYGAPQWFISARAATLRSSMRREPGNGSALVRSSLGPVWVLGEVGDEWRLVQEKHSGSLGYVPAKELTGRSLLIPEAFIRPLKEGEQVTVYQDRERQHAVASLYGGAMVRVLDASASGSAFVECIGASYDLEGAPGNIKGYVAQEEVQVFVQRWQVKYDTPTAYLKQDVNPGEGEPSWPAGAAVSVLGQAGDDCQVLYGAADGIHTSRIPSAWLEQTAIPGTCQGAGRRGYVWMPIDRDDEGYAQDYDVYVSPGEQITTSGQQLNELLAVCGDMLQLRAPGYAGLFAHGKDAKIIGEEELWLEEEMTRSSGTWTASEKEAGLWVFVVQPGQKACLELENEAWNKDEVYDVAASGETAAQYTVYLPAGTRVTMTGKGELRGLTRTSRGVEILSQQNPGEPSETEALWSGNGRYFCDGQLASHYDFFSYRVEPQPGGEDPYVCITNLFEADPAQPDLYPVENTMWLDLHPGEFLELHNVLLYVYYGNG